MRVIAVTHAIVATLAAVLRSLRTARINHQAPARKPRGEQTAAPGKQLASERRRSVIVNPGPRMYRQGLTTTWEQDLPRTRRSTGNAYLPRLLDAIARDLGPERRNHSRRVKPAGQYRTRSRTAVNITIFWASVAMLALRRRGLISSSRRSPSTSEDTRPARSMRKVPSLPKSICRP